MKSSNIINMSHRKEKLLVLIILLIQLNIFILSIYAREENVNGYSKKDKIIANEYILYEFQNNLKFEIRTNVSIDLDIQYDSKMKNKQLFFQINNSNSISLEINVKSNIQDFKFTSTPPNSLEKDQKRWNHQYESCYKIIANTTIQKITMQSRILTNYDLKLDKEYSFAVFKESEDDWELISTKLKFDDSSSEYYIESKISDLDANTDYYIAILEIEQPDLLWIWIFLIIILLSIISFSIIVSKTEYFDFLKKRITPISKGVHRLTLEDVLENENRNRLIDLILEEPGIHYKELLRKSNIAAGNLAWHLDILETYKIVGKKRIGKFLAYFPYYHKNPISNLNLKLSKSQLTLEILDIIENKPGIWINKIAKIKNMHSKTIQYHVNKLIDLEIVHTTIEGKKKKLYPNLDSEYFENRVKEKEES